MRLPHPTRHLSRVVGVAALAVLVASSVVAASQGAAEEQSQQTAAPAQSDYSITTELPVAEPAPAPAVIPVPATAPAPVKALAPLGKRTAPDVLITGSSTFSAAAVDELAGLAVGGTALAFRTGTVAVAGKPVPTVGVHPEQFRKYAAEGTAQATAVWQAVARGEAVASHEAAKRLGLALGDVLQLTPASGGPAVPVRLGALATTGVPDTDLVLDDALGDELGLPATTGLLLAAGKDTDPLDLASRVRAITGKSADVDLLTPPTANPTAFLTGGTAAKAFGAFSYEYFPDGTIAPDAAWVRNNIRTEAVPIFGTVTCHRLMLPQLRGALTEVVARGLADTLHTYDGCYVPRFIERNPERPISLHTWGIAIDLDASTNYRGIRGTMDSEVVQIFKRWGFRWGGDWKYTDSMHFEMGAILAP